ncbi:MAG: hypothetical protein M1119_08620 [Firmicutes bacterium]|nr:hypothetical protein [Bacillota bacterium]
MKTISCLIKYFKDPHGRKIQKLKERYQELDELSDVAVKIGDASAYRSLQSEMREVFFDYLTAVVVDSIYHLVPHVLIIWLISMVVPVISIPIINRQVSIFVAYLMAYLAFYVGKAIIKSIKSKLGHKLGLLGFTVSENKITN